MACTALPCFSLTFTVSLSVLFLYFSEPQPQCGIFPPMLSPRLPYPIDFAAFIYSRACRHIQKPQIWYPNYATATLNNIRKQEAPRHSLTNCKLQEMKHERWNMKTRKCHATSYNLRVFFSLVKHSVGLVLECSPEFQQGYSNLWVTVIKLKEGGLICDLSVITFYFLSKSLIIKCFIVYSL